MIRDDSLSYVQSYLHPRFSPLSGFVLNDQCTHGLIEEADFQGAVGHFGMLFLFGWGNSSVLNDKAKC
jgi:hypothetical protein